jgi:hypothetical protein
MCHRKVTEKVRISENHGRYTTKRLQLSLAQTLRKNAHLFTEITGKVQVFLSDENGCDFSMEAACSILVDSLAFLSIKCTYSACRIA